MIVTELAITFQAQTAKPFSTQLVKQSLNETSLLTLYTRTAAMSLTYYEL